VTLSAPERTLLDETVRAALAPADADADAVLAELGWFDMLAAERDDAIAVVFGALGATSHASTALDDVMASALGVDPSADLAVLLPAYGSWRPPGGIGLATRRVTTASALLVPGRERVPVASVATRPVRGVDPDAGLHVVELSTGGVFAIAGWDAVVALVRRAIAHEMAGACRAMLERAREHALGRAGLAATALDDVVVDALGIGPDAGLAAVLPRFGTWLPPGRIATDATGTRSRPGTSSVEAVVTRRVARPIPPGGRHEP